MTAVIRAPISREQQMKHDVLTKRHLQILQHLANGKQTKDAAKALKICMKTLKNHLTRARQLTKSKNTLQVVVWALRKGLIT